MWKLPQLVLWKFGGGDCVALHLFTPQNNKRNLSLLFSSASTLEKKYFKEAKNQRRKRILI
jgi:hypothetical protein